ncbi:MAG: flagellar export chaperone FlgN [Pseudomonadota bacterium]
MTKSNMGDTTYTMGIGFDHIEERMQHLLILHKTILDCLKHERISLIKNQAESLWDISQEKESAIEEVAAIQKSLIAEIKQIIPDAGEDTDIRLVHLRPCIPIDQRVRFDTLYYSLMRLKMEIRTYINENMQMIRDTLGFLDDLASIIMNVKDYQTTYDRGRSLNQTGLNIPRLVSREV